MIEFTSCEYQVALIVHFYPERTLDIVQSVSIDVLYSEVHNQITAGAITCHAKLIQELSAISLAVLYPFGDGQKHLATVKSKVLPKSHCDDWMLKQVAEHYVTEIGKAPGQLKRLYLAKAEKLTLYGRTAFDVVSRINEKLTMCLSATGVEISSPGKRLEPIVDMSWSNIKSISYKDSKLTILLQPGVDLDLEQLFAPGRSLLRSGRRKTSAHVSPERENAQSEIVVWGQNRAQVKQIMYVCSGNHELYVRFRRLEGAEMKAIRVSEERLSHSVEAVYEKYADALEYISSLKGTIEQLVEEKYQLEQRLSDSLSALHKVQTAAELIEANSSVCTEENGLLRTKCAELESLLLYSRGANVQTQQDSTRYLHVNQTKTAASNCHQMTATESAQLPRDLKHPDVRKLQSLLPHYAPFQELGASGKSCSVQELRPAPLAANFVPHNSFSAPQRPSNREKTLNKEALQSSRSYRVPLNSARHMHPSTTTTPQAASINSASTSCRTSTSPVSPPPTYDLFYERSQFISGAHTRNINRHRQANQSERSCQSNNRAGTDENISPIYQNISPSTHGEHIDHSSGHCNIKRQPNNAFAQILPDRFAVDGTNNLLKRNSGFRSRSSSIRSRWGRIGNNRKAGSLDRLLGKAGGASSGSKEHALSQRVDVDEAARNQRYNSGLRPSVSLSGDVWIHGAK